MIKTFGTMKSSVAGEVYDTTTAMLTRIGTYLNKRYFDVLRRINWNAYNYDYVLTTVASQKSYPLPDDFSKAISCVDSTNSKSLTEVESLTKIYNNSPTELSTIGSPNVYVILNDVVQLQPSAAATPSIKSSSSLDTTQTVTIKGMSGSVEVTETKTLTGTTAVAFSNSYTRITSVSKNGDTTGKITLYSGADDYAVLSPKTRVGRFKIIRFFPTPLGSYSIQLPYLIDPTPMISDEDYPIVDIDDIIEIGAKADAHSYQRREATANKYESLYESMIANYIWNEANSPNRVTMFQPKPYSRNITGASARLDGSLR